MSITDSEKTRRRALLQTHYDVENGHDMNGIMATFSPDGEMLYNRIAFSDSQSIRDAHALIGFTGTDGAIQDIHNYIDGEHFTDDEIIVEGRMCGKTDKGVRITNALRVRECDSVVEHLTVG